MVSVKGSLRAAFLHFGPALPAAHDGDSMRPFILTTLQAGKLPRWGLPLLCLLYALPGMIGRDPWRTADATGFGISLTMAWGGLRDWLMPNIFGDPVYDDSPFPYWIAALAMRALPFLAEHPVGRGVTVCSMLLLFAAVWYATYRVARLPGVQPSDPFGASVSRVDFGRAIADSALLVLLATIGLIARVHETTADAGQVALIAVFLFGAAVAIDAPRPGGWLAGLAAGASLPSGGPQVWVPLLLVLACLPLLIPAYRLVRSRFWTSALPPAVAVAAIWPLALVATGPEGHQYLARWWQGNLTLAIGPALENARYLVSTIPWFFWPAWPMVIWSLWRWRTRLSEPAVGLPLLCGATLLVPALLSPRAGESLLLPMIPPMAMLAAVGLPTIKRAAVSLVDWFSVTTFTLMGLAIWAYWIAWVTGFPPVMAFKAGQLAPGFRPGNILDEIVLGLLASAAWLGLVRWRVSRQPRMIWRAVMLASCGLVLMWFLLMTLWLPMFNERNTYRDVGLAVGQHHGNDGCVASRHLNPTARTSIAYFGRVGFGPEATCPWLVIEDQGPLAGVIAPQEAGYRLIWEGSRRRGQDERFRLYQRLAPARR